MKWEWDGLTDVDHLVGGPNFRPGENTLFRQRLVNQGIDERPVAHSPL